MHSSVFVYYTGQSRTKATIREFTFHNILSLSQSNFVSPTIVLSEAIKDMTIIQTQTCTDEDVNIINR